MNPEVDQIQTDHPGGFVRPRLSSNTVSPVVPDFYQEQSIFNNEYLSLPTSFNADSPASYWSMEYYDQDNGIKGGGGLGILAADYRRVYQQMDAPLLVVTPFYTQERHQDLQGFYHDERIEHRRPEPLYRNLGRVTIGTLMHEVVGLDYYDRTLGSTRILAITEPNFGELYPGNNGNDHRLYQDVALGFGGFKAVRHQGLELPVMHLNEAPTVFAAVARLDELCSMGMSFENALKEVKKQTLYTNHTLVQAVESEFGVVQFENLVMPNIKSGEVRNWIRESFSNQGRLKLSSLVIEMADVKNCVSGIHAKCADFYDRYNRKVEFEAVTNGISSKWILPEMMEYYHKIGVLTDVDLPAPSYRLRLDDIDPDQFRQLKAKGRGVLDEVLAHRKDQYDNPIIIPKDSLIFDFKRRFASYKRPEMVFNDPTNLARILQEQNAHFILTGMPHRNDEHMKDELTRLLYLVDGNPVLKERVHYVQDYDEEIGQALAFGSDCSINVPVVGNEACGTSWMKAAANGVILISTPDGGVADVNPIACLEVSGNEQIALYMRMMEAAYIARNKDLYKNIVVNQLKEYLPIISGERMMADYLRLFKQMYQIAAEENLVAA